MLGQLLRVVASVSQPDGQVRTYQGLQFVDSPFSTGYENPAFLIRSVPLADWDPEPPAIMPVELSSKSFGMAQSRARVYLLMVRESLVSDRYMDLVEHWITTVLPSSIPGQATVQGVVDYVRKVRGVLGFELHEAPISRDWVGRVLCRALLGGPSFIK